VWRQIGHVVASADFEDSESELEQLELAAFAERDQDTVTHA